MDKAISKQLVIARYNENIDWAKPLTPMVYDKGDYPISSEWTSWGLKNVGRECGTYLYHIVNRWENLADFTVFSQGNPFDHVSETFDKWMFDVGRGIVGYRLVSILEWDEFGRLIHWGKWKEDRDAGRMKPAKLTFAEWLNCYLDFKLLPIQALPYFPGAIFGASREAIHSRPKEVYEWLLESLSHHENPEESYYMERAWLPLLWRNGIELTIGQMGVGGHDGRLKMVGG